MAVAVDAPGSGEAETDVISLTIPAAMRFVRLVRIGAASIGNWSIPTRPDSEFAIRNLNGSMDEFAIFSAALSHAEIQEMYNNGKP